MGNNAVKQIEIEALSQSKAHTRQPGEVDVKNDIFGLIGYCMGSTLYENLAKKERKT